VDLTLADVPKEAGVVPATLIQRIYPIEDAPDFL
jgi:hypothetical protein